MDEQCSGETFSSQASEHVPGVDLLARSSTVLVVYGTGTV